MDDMSTMTLQFAFGLPTFDSIEHIAVFLLMLSILVVLHEGGHFLLARLNGVRVNDFAVGFGPTLLKWTSKRSGTNYRLNLLPIGGYCAMQGEDGKTSEAEQQRQFREQREQQHTALASPAGGGVAVLERPVSVTEPQPTAAADPAVASDNFQAKSTWGRLSIVVAGPVANFLLAFAIYVVAAVTFGVPSPTFSSTEIGPIADGSPAAKAGLRIGDRIVSVNGLAVSDGNKLVAQIQASAGKRIALGYVRGGATTVVSLVPIAVKVDGKTIGRIGFQRLPNFERVGIATAIPLAWTDFSAQMAGQFTGILALFSHPAEHFSNVSGVIGMSRAAAVYQDIGWAAYFELAATISIALGMLNLLPFPALDGGRAVFIIAEMLRGRPVDPEKEALVHVTGFAVLMVLMVFVAYHDISNIISGKGVF
jgi:regulator of sigma E protease